MMQRTAVVKLGAVLLALGAAIVAGCAPRVGHMVSSGVALSGDTDPLKSRWDDPKPEREIAVAAAPGARGVRLPAEAAPARKRRVRAEFMNSSQVAAQLKRGKRLAILPVGGLAATGPDIPLGAASLNVHATAALLAERWDAIAFPPIPYSWAPEQEGLPGTVGLSIAETMAYTRACIDSLFECGFERVIVLGDPSVYRQLYALVTTYYRDNRKVILVSRTNLLPASDEVTSALGYEPALDIKTMASLRILGHAGILEPGAGRAAATSGAAGAETAKAAADLERRLRGSGLGAPMPQRSLDGGPAVRPCVKAGDVEKAIGLMRTEAAKCDGVPAFYARYVEHMADLEAFAPWSLEGWDKAVAACRFDAIPADDTTPFEPAEDKPTGDVVIPAEEFPEEARPEYQRRYRAEFMTAAEMAARLKEDPVAILPCGAFEMHGPHGLLGTDTFEAHSECVVVARRWNAVVFPPIYYTYAGATERYPGSVSPSHEQTVDYVKAVARGLLRAGFRKVAVWWVHGPGGAMKEMAVKDLFHADGKAVFTARGRMFGGIQEALGYGSTEDIRTRAGLKILGHPGVFVVDEPEDIGVQKLSHHAIVELTKCGCRPSWYMGLPTHHLPVHKSVRSGDEDKVIPLMRESAKRLDDAPRLMDEYLEKMGHPNKAAP